MHECAYPIYILPLHEEIYNCVVLKLSDAWWRLRS